MGLHNGALGRRRKRDAVVCRAGSVRQAEGATAISGDGIHTVGKLPGENAGAQVDVLKTTGDMAVPVRVEAAGSREKAAQSGAEFCATHRKSILTLQARGGEVSGWSRGRRPDNSSSTVAARRGE